MRVPIVPSVGLTACTNKDGAYRQLLARKWPESRKEYLLLKEVGRGATAEVWVGQCNSSVLIAVKIFHLDRIPGDKGIARREIEIMSRFCHSNILPVLASFHDGEDMWMVMPYVSGGAVSSILHHRHPAGFQEAAIAAVASGVLSALKCLHEAGVMHRDIKGANVLVSDIGHVFLADFGLACSFNDTNCSHTAAASIAVKLQGEVAAAAAAAEAGASRSSLVGTTAFMAPEVINASHDLECYDQRADVWSFGILLLEMAHGQAPFAHCSLEETAVRVVNHSPPTLQQPTDGRIFTEEFKDICSLCLVKDVSCRPTVTELLAHPFIQNNAAESADLARLLFSMTEDSSEKGGLKPSPSMKDGFPEAVPDRMAYAAAHALKILDKALSREPPLGQKEYKYPHLHRLSFDPRLRREDLLNCKAILFGKAKRSGGLVTSAAVGRAFVMARQTAKDGSVFWSAPHFITISGHGLGISVGTQELGFIMVLQSTEALLVESQPMMVRGHSSFSRSTLGKGSGGQIMVGSLGTPLKMFHFAEGYMADVTAIGWQLDANIEMDTAMYGADLAKASLILGGKVRPPPQFDALIAALSEAEQAPEDFVPAAIE